VHLQFSKYVKGPTISDKLSFEVFYAEYKTSTIRLCFYVEVLPKMLFSVSRMRKIYLVVIVAIGNHAGIMQAIYINQKFRINRNKFTYSNIILYSLGLIYLLLRVLHARIIRQNVIVPYIYFLFFCVEIPFMDTFIFNIAEFC